MPLIDNAGFQRLSFQELLDRVQPFSPFGKKALNHLTPYTKGQESDLEEEFTRLSHVQEYVNHNEETISLIEHTLSAFKDIRPLLNNCLKKYIADEVDCFEIKELIYYMKELQSFFNNDVFVYFQLKPLEELIHLLDPNNEKTMTFHFYNIYSPELATVRKEKKNLEDKIFITKDEAEKQQLLQERALIIANEEKSEYKVRAILTKKIKPFIPTILSNIEKITLLDMTLAKIRFFKKYDCKRPNISNSPTIYLKNIVNIRVKEFVHSKLQKFTPISIELSSGSTVITGANMGGKSVALKTITESVLLFHYGFFLPCEESILSLMDFVQFITDDMQDFSQGISTFGAEIVKLKDITNNLQTNQHGLVIFDEFARGTNPREGQKFVRALLKYLNKFSTISLITSHFDDVIVPNTTHYQVIGLKNIDLNKLQQNIRVSINNIQEYMDYRLEKTESINIPHDAFNVAKLIGLDTELEQIIQNEYDRS